MNLFARLERLCFIALRQSGKIPFWFGVDWGAFAKSI